MFMIRNVGKLLFGESSKQDIIQIDSGQLYLIRPQSPKGHSECIFKDAAACIRRTATPFHYQLVVQRAFEEGEEQLAEDIDEDDGSRDEKTFLLDESLRFRSSIRDGQAVLSWNDLLGDPGDMYEFVCDTSTQQGQVHTFEMVAIQCQYERKYQKSHETATDADLEQFSFANDPEPEIPAPLPEPDKKKAPTTPQKAIVKAKPTAVSKQEIPAAPEGDIIAKEKAELHLFHVESGNFVLQDDECIASVIDEGGWNYTLHIEGADKPWLSVKIITDISPVFNFEYLSFIFNAYDDDNSAFSWLLRFKDTKVLERFQEGVMRALWEHLNQIKWLKTKEDERDYIIDAFNDITMEDADEAEAAASDEEEQGSESEETVTTSDDEEDEEDIQPKDGGENSQLAVGYKHDRSFVVRGSKIGVFRHTRDDKVKFATTINKVQTPKGKLFEPSKVMLHAEDSSMVLQNSLDPSRLYKMDLESGKVVDEWKIHEDIPTINFGPESKFAQMTAEQTFLGHSRNALFRIDPRVSGEKLVDSELKQYASKNDFSAMATTDKGYIAVASNKGDVRLFDRLGINAKTHLPALGEPIIGVDVSADGRWVLATCRTYLLLVDALQHSGKNEGKLGFERSFGKDNKPKPRRLALSPEHVAQFQTETKSPISFTAAKFNTGLEANETSIITSTGPFVITWNMKKVLRGKAKDSYTIKRYTDEIKADNFRFGSDKNVIVALPHEVDMVAKGTFKKPTRESISTPMKNLRSRSSIVNSPY